MLTAVCGLVGMTPTVIAFQGSGPRPMCCSAVLIMPVACFDCPSATESTFGILPGATVSAAVTSTCGPQRSVLYAAVVNATLAGLRCQRLKELLF